MQRCWLMLVGLTAAFRAEAQTPEPPVYTLALADALQQATNNNPLYRQRLNDLGTARMRLRNAWGQLLPSASVSTGLDYTGAGSTNFGQGFVRQTSAVIGSSYSLGVMWQLDGARLIAPREQRAGRQAVDAEITNEESQLRFAVTSQYLTAMQAAAQFEVAQQQVERNRQFLDLATARHRVGQATLVEVRQAEVQKSQADVALLQREQANRDAKLELFRRIGIAPPVEVDQVALTDSFPVAEPALLLDDLLGAGREQNPGLRALEARQRSAALGVSSAKTAFLPSLSLRAGWSGYTQRQTDEGLLLSTTLAGAQSSAGGCLTLDSIRAGVGLGTVGTAGCYASAGLDGTGTQLTPETRRAILDANNRFPFDFTRQPFGASLTITLPLFTGFGRSLRLQQARELALDAEESVRAQRLQVETEIRSRYLAMGTAYRTIAAQEVSRTAAREQLRLAQDRYRVGSGSALEVADAQSSVQRAEGDYVNAVYDYHKALAALEAAVGRPLVH